MNAVSAALLEAWSADHAGAAFRLHLSFVSGATVAGSVLKAEQEHIVLQPEKGPPVYVSTSHVVMVGIEWLP